MPKTLHQSAALRGDIAAVRSFLDEGLVVDLEDEQGRTPLMLTAYHGHFAIAQLLIEAGANVNAKDHFNYSPLTWAILGWSLYSHNTKVGLMLLNNNSQIDAISSVAYETFALSAAEDHISVLHLLIEHESKVSTEKEREILGLIHKVTKGK